MKTRIADMVRNAQHSPSEIGTIIDVYHPRLKRYLRKTLSTTDIDDVLQETFARVFLHLKDVRYPAQFESWLYTICRNCLASHIIREKRTPDPLPDLDDFSTDVIDDEPTNIADLVERLPSLGSDGETYIRLRYMCGFGYSDIAAVLGTSESRVKSRLYTFRRRLQAEMAAPVRGMPREPSQILYEVIMKSVENIRLGAFVLSRMSLRSQQTLCKCVADNRKFETRVLEECHDIEGGTDFVLAFDGRLDLWEFAEILSQADEPVQGRILSGITDEPFAAALRQETIVADLHFMEKPSIELETKIHDSGVLIVSLSGYIDNFCADEFHQKVYQLTERDITRIVFDCKDFRYISAAGIGTFAAITNATAEKNGRLVVCNLGPAITAVFEMLGIDRIIEIAATLDDAVALALKTPEASPVHGRITPTEFPLLPVGGSTQASATFCGHIERSSPSTYDFFDYRRVADDQWFAVSGEIAGRGPTAAAISAQIAATFHLVATRSADRPPDIKTALYTMNERLLELDIHTSFICMRLLLLHPEKRTCIVGNAGASTVPVYRSSTGSMDTVALNRAVPLGIISNELIHKRCPFQENRIDINPGDTIFLYTDGLEESESKTREPFGQDRIFGIIANSLNTSGNLDETITALVREEKRHRNGISRKNDMPILGIRIVKET